MYELLVSSPEKARSMPVAPSARANGSCFEMMQATVANPDDPDTRARREIRYPLFSYLLPALFPHFRPRARIRNVRIALQCSSHTDSYARAIRATRAQCPRHVAGVALRAVSAPDRHEAAPCA